MPEEELRRQLLRLALLMEQQEREIKSIREELKALARAEDLAKTDKRIDAIYSLGKWLLLLCVGTVATAFMNFILNGGFNAGS